MFPIDTKSGSKFGLQYRIIKRLPEFLELEKSMKNKYPKIPSIPIRKESELNQKHEGQLLELFEVILNIASSIN